jgi:hypothetical protein
LLFNVSPDGGHHHPDTLSLQIWAGGRPLLVDPGVGHYYTGEREISQQSWWHNGPTLGRTHLPSDLSPALLHWYTAADLDYAAGRISVHTPDGLICIVRHVLFVDRALWIVHDEFLGQSRKTEIWENFNFGKMTLSEGPTGWVGRLPGTELWMMPVQEGWNAEVEQGRMWESYGSEGVATEVLHLRADGVRARSGFTAVLLPTTGGAAPDIGAHVDSTGQRAGTLIVLDLEGQARDFHLVAPGGESAHLVRPHRP